jgi:hypothetical protein
MYISINIDRLYIPSRRGIVNAKRESSVNLAFGTAGLPVATKLGRVMVVSINDTCCTAQIVQIICTPQAIALGSGSIFE